MSKDCPACGMVNPDTGTRCDCGHEFNGRPVAPWVRPRDATLVAGLGFVQGLGNIGFAVLGSVAPRWWGQYSAGEAAVMLLQGAAMIVLAVATYRGKMWGAWGLCAIAVFAMALSFVSAGTPYGLLFVVVYTLGAVKLHRAQRLPGRPAPATQP